MEKKKWCVYMHISPSNKVYVGITCKRPQARWDNGNGYKKQPYFYNAIKKYGWCNFEHIIWADKLTETEAKEWEVRLIALFDTMNSNIGYNCKPGGDIGNYGMHMSEETKMKISNSKKGTIPSDEARIRMSEAQKKRWDDEKRKRASQQYSGDKNPMYGVHRYGSEAPMYGKKHTEESREKMRKSQLELKNKNRIPVICIETEVIYTSSYDASRKTGISQSSIAGCCRHENHRKTAGGYHWRYATEEEDAEYAHNWN